MPERKYTMVVVITLILVAVILVAMWKVFTKAGKPGWHSLIPYLNAYDLATIAWNKKMAGIFVGATVVYSVLSGIQSGMAANGDSNGFLTFLVGILGIFYLVIDVMIIHKLSKSFGHGVGFTLGLIFLTPIFLCILGFGSSQYIGPEGNPVAGGAAPVGSNPFDNSNPYA